MSLLSKSLLLVVLSIPVVCHAWWNKDWTQRTKIVLNTTPTGAGLSSPINSLPVAVRLHSGNFSFSDAKEDGSDLRFVAGDDKTPLAFKIEHFDGVGEIAVVWVQVPSITPNVNTNLVYAYYGNPNAPAESAGSAVFDASYLAVWHFAEKNAPAHDESNNHLTSSASVPVASDGVLGGAAKLDDTPITVTAGDRLKMVAGSAFTVSMWIKPTRVDAGNLYQQGSLQIGFQAGKLNASLGNMNITGGEIKAGAWQAIALSAGAGKVSLYLDGVPVAQVDSGTPNIMGDLKVGSVYTGLLDELEISNVARSADYLKTSYAAQGNDGKLVETTKESQDDADSADSGSPGYFGILVGNLTSDAWVVIGILMIMFAIALWVMITKGIMIGQVEKANWAFLRRFREVTDAELLSIQTHADMERSSLFRLYDSGVREVNKRIQARGKASGKTTLNGASIDAIKASVDADQVRENHKLNNLMVLLTIAISGGPFLGLLGTVVGVMITFAAIAAAGDVNVNAIAPGIAAALLATVAGLSVAIPSLFGYNWLAAKIRNISADMQIFVDELVTRVAETYGD
jgi:biopolymer transport protein ExbB